MTSVAIQNWTESFRDDPTWLSDFRKEAYAAFQELSWTDLDQEQWRVLGAGDFIPKQAPKTVRLKTRPSRVPGVMDLFDSRVSGLAQKFLWKSLENHYNDKWWLLGLALIESGDLILGQKSKKPSPVLLEVDTLVSGRPTFHFQFVHVGEGQRLELIEDLQSRRSKMEGHFIRFMEMELEEGAEIHRILVQEWSDTMSGMLFDSSRLESESKLHTAFLGLGGRRFRYESRTILQGENAQLHHVGLNLTSGEQVFDSNLIQTHLAPRTTSELLVRSVLGGKSRTAFNGNIIIDPQAPQTEANQKSLNLLLSPTAHALALPKLEIGTDQVQCRHGAAVSSLDEEQIFYLMSRGFSRSQAMRVLVEGFATDLLKEIKNEAFRLRVKDRFESKLGDLLP